MAYEQTLYLGLLSTEFQGPLCHSTSESPTVPGITFLEYYGVENEEIYHLGNSSLLLPQTDYQIGRHIHHATFASPRKARRRIKQLAEMAVSEALEAAS